jgi:hypothetical protein
MITLKHKNVEYFYYKANYNVNVYFDAYANKQIPTNKQTIKLKK